ncbi:hypothetical protein [Virgibacillus halodenitrificans]|uniref:hypothetical protein n=1 Tax=Virgibacillus halodenitrificans TaxID=1482 RepID=UPI001F428DBE|nr:hypothetical protein [Virgibacillus halodenitrificans]
MRKNFYDRNNNDVEGVGNHHHKHYCNHCCKYDCSCGRVEDVVDRVICRKEIQKTAEFLLPVSVGPLNTGLIATLTTFLGVDLEALNAEVEPNYTGIVQEITVLKDKVINLGYIPASLNITLLGAPVISLPIRIFFQEHTDVKGVCPGDIVYESDPKVEAVLNEPLIGTDANGGLVVNLLLFKAIVRTNLTVIHRGVERNGHFYDMDENRCAPSAMPVPINSPQMLTPNTA